MKLYDKLMILGEAARYDASCASSGSGRQGKKDGIGNAHMAGICHTWAEDGRCVSLLKILLSNDCVFDCAYCANRRSAEVKRASFTPDEVALITSEFYRRNYIEGLFLSSAVVCSPDLTMELMLEALRKLRNEYGFCGYIHVKVIPGASRDLIAAIGLLADRVSVNIELPSESGLKLLAPQKTRERIIVPMDRIRLLKEQNREERSQFRNAPLFAPAGQSTQMIVGATDDSDRKILTLSSALYGKYAMKRVYFSAYVPVGVHPALPAPDVKVPLRREHRLYQADWLMRFYDFRADEITEDGDNLDLELDPKCAWAVRHPEFFPVDVNSADYSVLLRVPGIGVKSARRILAARRCRRLDIDDLRRLGAVTKRAVYFVCFGRKFYGLRRSDISVLRSNLSDEAAVSQQMTLEEFMPQVSVVFSGAKALTEGGIHK
ncbi:MAG: putative DNA modification/repair radical SAM protein [Clostridia bacterium]|nr:putative DNA modification/repair radical SAM protein [Clostridia bacterium]